MTAEWEAKLLRIERGEMEPEEFMTEIKDMLSSLVKTSEAVKGASTLMKNKVAGICPNCGNAVIEREKGWFCENASVALRCGRTMPTSSGWASIWMAAWWISCCGMAGCG